MLRFYPGDQVQITAVYRLRKLISKYGTRGVVVKVTRYGNIFVLFKDGRAKPYTSMMKSSSLRKLTPIELLAEAGR